MNPAARLVIGILGFVVAATTTTICIVAIITRDLTVVEKIATFALGNVSGVLAKVGFDKLVGGETIPLTPDGTAVKTQEQQS